MNLKNIFSISMLLLSLNGCTQNVNLFNDIGDFKPINKFNNKIELCIDLEEIPRHYSRYPREIVNKRFEYVFELRDALSKKTEYGFNNLFSEVEKCNTKNDSNYLINLKFAQTDLDIACSYADSNFDLAGFASVIYFSIIEKSTFDKIDKRITISDEATHDGLGGDINLVNTVIDKSLKELFDYLITDHEVLKFFNENVTTKKINDRLKTLEKLYMDRLINEDEYKERRKKILDDV